jgi:hypothetical protein
VRERSEETTDTQRGQSGLDRLALFVLGVLLVLLVAPTVLGFAGIDIRAANPADSGPSGLVVLAVEGDSIKNGSVGEVRVVTTVVGDGRVAPGALSARWTAGEWYRLAPAGSGGADGEFTVEIEEGDRAILTFDLGTDDVSGVGEFGSRLRAGETATLTLIGTDTRVTRQVQVPEPLPASGPVAL